MCCFYFEILDIGLPPSAATPTIHSRLALSLYRYTKHAQLQGSSLRNRFTLNNEKIASKLRMRQKQRAEHRHSAQVNGERAGALANERKKRHRDSFRVADKKDIDIVSTINTCIFLALTSSHTTSRARIIVWAWA